MADLQTIPARNGVATFVPAGQTIKIINTSGGQVIDTWAFALPAPDSKPGEETGEDKSGEEKPDDAKSPSAKAPPKRSKKTNAADLPSQEDAEKATQEMLKKDPPDQTPQKSSWSSYVPSLGLTSSATSGKKTGETEQQKNSRTWASYFPSGQGFGSYIPKKATDTVSAFAKDHQRDPNKSYMAQLQDFSKTPVGAAGWRAVTGSGYSGSLYAGYQAWNATHAADAPAMEFLSMAHSRSATLHMSPRVDDTLVSNLREPMLTLVEDTSPGVHDTLIAACDPARYKGLGVEQWAEHGSCAENLVLALKELNERAGLKGAKGVGADVTVNSVPAPLNLFMHIPWDAAGELGMRAPETRAGDFVRLRAERDVVVVMSACPQDLTDINRRNPTDAHFLVEGAEPARDALRRTQPVAKKKKQRPPPRKIASSQVPPGSGAQKDGGGPPEDDPTPSAKKPSGPRKAASPPKKPAATSTAGTGPTAAPPKKKPIPRPVTSNEKADADGPETNGTSTPPPPPLAEKKKPRKLTSKPKPKPAAKTEG